MDKISLVGSEFKPGKRLATAFVITLLFSVNACPETKQSPADPARHLGVVLGAGIGSYREDLVVPISFDGPAFILGGQYSVRTARNSLQIRLCISAAPLKNRFSHEAYSTTLELRPSWTRMVWSNGHSRQFWGGIALPLQMRNLFLASWDDAHLYWLTTHSLAVVGEYHTSLPRLGYTVIRLDLPIIGLVSRPPDYRYRQQEPLNHFSYHFSAPNKSFDLKTIWGFQSPLLQVMIRPESRGTLLSLGLELALDHCREPKDIWILNTRLLVRYQWKIS
ncbi:MAG: hypothetical protein OEW48_16955 [Phycisphaerae bacterium]|nr:hypothetical protein [Phycisphaerae bacterium]